MKLINQDLSNQTIKGEQQSLVQGCNIQGAVFTEDWRGSDFLGNTGAADFSGARIEMGYWVGNDLKGSWFPAEIGIMQHDPVTEIIRAGAEFLKDTMSRGAYETILAAASWAKQNPAAASWDTSKDHWYTSLYRDEIIVASREIYKGYDIAERFEEMLEAFQKGDKLWMPSFSTTSTVKWDDAEVSVDLMNLPDLPDPSRSTLARYIESQADAMSAESHYVFVYSKVPLVIGRINNPDDWLRTRKGY